MVEAAVMRVKDWQQRFWKVIESHRESQFQWGVFDCGTFAIEAVTAVRGDSFKEEAEKLFGNWSSAIEAARATRAGMSVCASIVFGNARSPWTLRMGDVGVFKDDRDRDTYCVHDGAGFICPAAVGFQRVPFQRAYVGWSV